MSEPILAVIDRLEVLVCGLDLGGTIHLFNRPCERVTGLAREEAIGRNWLELFATGVRGDHVQALWSQAREQSPSKPFEALCRNRRNVRWQFSRHDEVSPELVALWAVGIDVTEEREAIVRARELDGVRTLGNLIAGLTHELRNPLNGISLQLQLAERSLARRQDQDLAPIAAAVSQASAETRRISHILDDFLAFARPLPLEVERVDVRGIIARAIERSAPRARAAGVAIAFEPGGETVAEVDPTRVETAICQLLANAIDAAATTPEQTATVRLAVAGNSVMVDVEDRGSGVPSMEALFEPFFSTKTGGTGLGLAIAQRVALDHGGSITHTRRDGATVFRLELPIVAGVAS